MQRVLLLYNTDYDDELTAESGTDVSAVAESAMAVCEGIRASGLAAEALGIHGNDLDSVLPRLQQRDFDLVFNIVESLCGDTRNELLMPALLDLLGVPYTGPSALAIGLCLHKVTCKDILLGRGIATPPHVVLESVDQLSDPQFRESLSALTYPYFLKLAREDASIGIEASNRAENAEELCKRGRELLEKYKQPVLAEQYIDGREVNVTLIGNGGGLRALPLHEIDFAKMPPGRPHIVSYAAKWDEEHVDYEGTKPVPMRDLSPELEARIIETAKAAYQVLGLQDFGRVDLRIDRAGQPWVIDINPNCDLSPDAGVARAAESSGLTYPQLVREICSIAWQRHGGNGD